MFYGDTIQETRQMFFSSWEQYLQKRDLTPLEQQIVQVLLDHPEYHKIIEQGSKFKEQAYYPELGQTNPFLHMGLHLGVREQIATDRPAGITQAFKKLLSKYHDPLEVEHLIMEQLAECLWLSQKNNQPPDEQLYLDALANIAGVTP
jgi:hypothetical protein